VRWNCKVEVFGWTVKPGELIHADKHRFIVFPRQDQVQLVEAVRFMDSNECQTMIAAANNSSGLSTEETLQAIDTACDKFATNTEARFGRKGGW